MSVWVPPTSIPAKNDGDPLIAKDLKDLVASLQAFLNGSVGNVNINAALDPTERIAYAKLALAGAIQPSDIAGISFSTFTNLKVKAQASPNNTVLVQAGNYLSLAGLGTRVYAGGSSSAFANTSGVGQNRIDVLTIDDAGALAINQGVEAGSPVAPSYPTTKIALAEIYIRYNATAIIIKDADDLTNSYIRRDARPLVNFPPVSDARDLSSFADDFLVGKDAGAADTWIDANLYDALGAAGKNVALMETDGSHVYQMTTVASAGAVGLAVTKIRCRLRLNQDMTLVQEIRAYDPGATAMDNILLGLQDRSGGDAANEANCIGWLKGTTAGKWRFRCAKGGTASQTDDIGNRTGWQRLRTEITRSNGGAILQVRAFIDDVEISGSPFTTNIPDSVVLKPVLWGKAPGAGTTDLRVDRWSTVWMVPPLNS